MLMAKVGAGSRSCCLKCSVSPCSPGPSTVLPRHRLVIVRRRAQVFAPVVLWFSVQLQEGAWQDRGGRATRVARRSHADAAAAGAQARGCRVPLPRLQACRHVSVLGEAWVPGSSRTGLHRLADIGVPGRRRRCEHNSCTPRSSSLVAHRGEPLPSIEQSLPSRM